MESFGHTYIMHKATFPRVFFEIYLGGAYQKRTRFVSDIFTFKIIVGGKQRWGYIPFTHYGKNAHSVIDESGNV